MNSCSRITRRAFPLFATTLLAVALSYAADTNAVPETAVQHPETSNQKPGTGNLKPTPQPSTPNSPLREHDTDEIDLEEIDDSADAAKKALVKPTTQDVGFLDISCDEATLADILRQFRKTTQANIIFDDSSNLQKRVSATLTHVPWKDALQSILKTRNFRLEERNGIYFVMEDIETIPILTKSFTLNHASADELATLFNENYGLKDAKGAVIKKIANAFSGANVVVVTAPEKTIQNCEEIIKSIDKAVAQIYIEARFLELSSAALHKLGVQWDALESWKVSASGLKAGYESNRGEAANYGEVSTQRSLTKSTSVSKSTSSSASSDGTSTASATSSSTPTENSSQTLAGLVPAAIGAAGRAGIEAADMAWKNASGFSGQLSAQDFSLALSAFESLGEGKIFSNPKVIVSNGKEANVDMTTKFPNVDVSSQRSTSTANPYTDISTRIQVIPGDKDKGIFAGDIFYSWGITLSVKPRISPDGLISVIITPTISQLDTSSISENGFYRVGSGSGSSENANTSTYYSKYPVIEMKRITTEFTMKDGATAVIGGLSKTTEDDVDTGIPYLRKLPWIGQKLFGWKSREKVQKEIIVCVTIGIADPADLPRDMGLPQNAVIGREYVQGKRLEPGQRKGSADEILALDTEDLDKQHEKRAAAADPKTDRPASQGKDQKSLKDTQPQTQEPPAEDTKSDGRLASISLNRDSRPSYGTVSVKLSSVQ